MISLINPKFLNRLNSGCCAINELKIKYKYKINKIFITDESIHLKSFFKNKININRKSKINIFAKETAGPINMDIGINDINITSEYYGYDVSCFNFNDGSIEAIVLGGVPSYSYVWSTGSFNDNIFNLIADNYLLTLEDANNCQVIDSISLVQPDSLFMDVILFPDTCRLGLGQAIVNVTGGTQPYSYNWSNGVSVNDFSNFFSGNYKLIVNDANLCEINDSVSVANIPGPIIDFIIASEWEKLYEQLDDPIVFADKTDPNGQEILFWNWDFGDNYFSNDSIAYHSYADTGIYVVTLITQSSYNCLDTLSKEVRITDFNIFIPNAFTPFSSDDNLNDVFIAYGVGIT